MTSLSSDPKRHKYEAYILFKALEIHSGISILRLDSKKRTTALTAYRDMAYFIAVNLVWMTPLEAARAFDVSRSTIINSLVRTSDRCELDSYMNYIFKVYDTASGLMDSA